MEHNIYLDLNSSYDDHIQMENEEEIMDKEENPDDEPQEIVQVKKSICQTMLNLLKSITIGKK